MINIVYRLKSPKFFEEAIDEVDLDGVVVRPTHLSICQADQRYYQGSRPSEVLDEKLPMALIHEAIGEVVFDSKGNFKSGDKVVMIPNTPLCDDIYAPNYSYNSKFRGSGFDGFTSDLINLPSDRVVKIPDDFNLNVSAFIELISVAYQGINKFKQIAITPKDNLGVWGDGNLGFITALLLKELFPESKVIVFGKHQENLNLFSFADEICRIHDVDGVTIDHAFECVGSSASQTAIDQIIDLIMNNDDATDVIIDNGSSDFIPLINYIKTTQIFEMLKDMGLRSLMTKIQKVYIPDVDENSSEMERVLWKIKGQDEEEY